MNKKYFKFNHTELLLKLENSDTRCILRNYFLNLINYIQELNKNSNSSTKTLLYKFINKYDVGDREGYQIYEFLKRNFPLNID